MTSLFDRMRNAFDAFQNNPKEQLGSPAALLDPYSVYTNIEGTPYNPDKLMQRQGQFIYDEMRIDEQCHAALYFKKMAVLAPGFSIQSPDDQADDWEVTEFIRSQIEDLPGTFEQAILQILTALDFGFSVTEKNLNIVREGSFSGLIGIEELITKYPYPFEFHISKGGKLERLSQEGHKDNLPLGKFILYANFLEFANHYGRSDLRMAYRAWWIKENTLRWLGQLLERYGIPPIFLMYDHEVYKDENIVKKLRNTLTKLRAASNALLPRPSRTKDIGDPHLEPWAPELATQGRDVFIPTLRILDQMIARAILMPNLMGFTSDEGTGLALSRGKVSFEAFMLVVKYSQKQIAARAVNDQLIRPLCDLNFPNLKSYPLFRFNPILDEQSVLLLERWENLVNKGVTDHQPQDERHVRSMMNWPEWDEEFAAEQERKDEERQRQIAGEGTPDQEEVAEQRALLDRTEQFPRTYQLSREPNKFERHVNFRQVHRELVGLEDRHIQDLATTFGLVRERIIAALERNIRNPQKWLRGLKSLPLKQRIQNEIGEMLQEAYDTGFNQAAEEMSKATGKRFQTGPTFVPRDALRFLRNKKFIIAGVLDERILGEAKTALMAGIEAGESVPQMVERLSNVLGPYSDEPHRLEAIVRTNITDAMNQGRLVSSRRNSEFLNGFEYSAILDARTTQVCRHLDGRIFRKDSPDLQRLKPPRHHNCRSLLVPVTIDIPVAPDEYISPGQVGRGIELSGKGF